MSFTHLSIRYKLMALLLGSTLFVLLLSTGANIASKLFDTEKELRGKLTPLAVVLGSQVSAALTFNDAAAAREDLQAELRGPHRGHIPARSGADDDQIESFGLCHG